MRISPSNYFSRLKRILIGCVFVILWQVFLVLCTPVFLPCQMLYPTKMMSLLENPFEILCHSLTFGSIFTTRDSRFIVIKSAHLIWKSTV